MDQDVLLYVSLQMTCDMIMGSGVEESMSEVWETRDTTDQVWD
jgi:hypothetical protein